MKNLFYKQFVESLALILLMASCSLDNSKQELPAPKRTISNASCDRCPPVLAEPAPYTIVNTPYKAAEITTSGNNVTFMLSTEKNEEPEGYKIYYRNLNYTSNTDPFIYLPSPGARYISASECLKVWIVTSTGGLYYNDFSSSGPSVWTQFVANNQPLFSAVSAANDENRLFALGATLDSFGEHPVYLYNQNSNSWSQVGTQGGQRLVVDGFGRPWLVTSSGLLYRSAGGGQTFSGWNNMSRPDEAPVRDVATFMTTTNSTPRHAPCILAKVTSNTYNVFWQEYPFSTTQTTWNSNLEGSGTRITTSAEFLWLISNDGDVWNRPL